MMASCLLWGRKRDSVKVLEAVLWSFGLCIPMVAWVIGGAYVPKRDKRASKPSRWERFKMSWQEATKEIGIRVENWVNRWDTTRQRARDDRRTRARARKRAKVTGRFYYRYGTKKRGAQVCHKLPRGSRMPAGLAKRKSRERRAQIQARWEQAKRDLRLRVSQWSAKACRLITPCQGWPTFLKTWAYRASRTWEKWKYKPRPDWVAFSAGAAQGPPFAYDSDSFMIAVDNCATSSMTNRMEDFVGEPVPVNTTIKGVGGPAQAKFKGTVRWRIEDDQGKIHVLTLPGTHYAPGLPFRLLSPQHWAQQVGEGKETYQVTRSTQIELHWGSQGDQHLRTIPLDPRSNVGTFYSAPGYKEYAAFASLNSEEENGLYCCQSCFTLPTLIPPDEEETKQGTGAISPPAGEKGVRQSQGTPESPGQEGPVLIDFQDDEIDQLPKQQQPERALDNPQAELLRWHYRLGHASFAKLVAMAQRGDIPKRLATCPIPMCAGCQYGEFTKRPWRTKAPPQTLNHLNTVTAPGACVSVDQLESRTPGFIAQLSGFLTKARYNSATVFVDHFSRLSYVHLQRSTGGEETLEAKRAFERFAERNGVQVLNYHADNGRFQETLFLADCARRGQGVTLCGVNAHFQNGIAEKRIRDLQEKARTNMLHAKQRWPSAISTNLWPYALRLANDVHQATPQKGTGISPLERFTGAEVKPNVGDYHHFGAPVYCLDSDLASGKSIEKWMPRARLGIYLGLSPRHARSVALVLNPTTGFVSPQFHVKFDDLFETVRDNSVKAHGIWKEKAQFVGSASAKFRSKSQALREIAEDSEYLPPGVPIEREPRVEDPGAETLPKELLVEVPEATIRRSTRISRPTEALLDSIAQKHLALPVCYEAIKEDPYEDVDIDVMDPFALAASSDPDTMYLHEALKQPDRADFVKAMQSEVAAHTDRGHWKIVHRDQVPAGMDILPSVWAMRRKRRIKTGEIYKWKARLNLHGGKQKHGVNFWETYAPVVTWSAIRLVLILAILHKWHTRQVDFVLAYPQADVECDMYMQLPQGFELEGSLDKRDYCLKILKNIYGQKQAGRVWNQHLHKGLVKIGFVQSEIDHCVYYRGTTVFLLYVDDGVLASHQEGDIAQVLELLDDSFDMTDEGDLSDYLGVHIEELPDGKLSLTQPRLIDQVIEMLNFQAKTKSRPTPASPTKILRKDEGGAPHQADWSYRSLIGKLNFLEKSTRPEIAYAVHQCARFSSNPKESHTDAATRVVRYLSGTRDQGLILNPTEHSFECYADADFCGLWDHDTALEDPSTAKSRTGYVILYAGCPLIWASKLQGETALSTTEAEYISLSTALRETIPMMNLLEEFCDHKLVDARITPKVYCKAFEDNSGAFEMARMHKMRPRTKYLNTKWHHFRGHVAKGLIQIFKVATEDQLGDLFTKPLEEKTFLRFRWLIQGW
jgi:hypothetical protein